MAQKCDHEIAQQYRISTRKWGDQENAPFSYFAGELRDDAEVAGNNVALYNRHAAPTKA
jgi:hypothetical protein